MHYLYTDGGARGNPGPSAIAYVLKGEAKDTLKSEGEYLGKATNNYAEYQALIKGLTAAEALGVKYLTCFLDSELVVKQLSGEYKVKDLRLKDLYAQVKVLEGRFDFVKYSYVPRTKNREADKMVNEVLDGRPSR